MGEDIPRVTLSGSRIYWDSYDYAGTLDKSFPGQDASDFCYCLAYNDKGPLTDGTLVGLLLVKPGAKDETSWIWLVALSDGSHWWLEGWCDYTGWDCRSGNEWSRYE